MLSHLILQAIMPLRGNRVWLHETSSSIASCQDKFVFKNGSWGLFETSLTSNNFPFLEIRLTTYVMIA